MYRSKTTRLILTLLLITLISSYSNFAWSDVSILGSKNSLKLTPMSSSQLTPIQIFNYFPLCKMPSSYGPKCRSFSLEKNNKYSPSQIENIEITTIKGNKLEIITDSWNYIFSAQRKSDGKYSVQFTDDGIVGTYLVTITYYLIWEEKNQNWTIVAERVDYIRGNKEEKEVEGKYKSFNEPISFLSPK